ncbi:MAG TPA: ATP-binding protein, partial [Opitutus sp.]|nr:ATP-binding protein [Opitutus sp.]
TEVLRQDTEGTPLAEAVETIARNADAQSRIVDDLLDMNRITSGKLRLDIQPVDLDTIAKASVETLRPAAEAKGVQLLTVLDPRVGTTMGDPNRLQQVFWNLLSNAIKFTPKGGRVQMVLRRFEARLEINITDTGEGIAPEFLPYVFDRFRQADGSTTRRHGGLGIGLAIVRQLVELHGGEVGVISPGPGQGATFTVSFPINAVQPVAVARPAHPAAATLRRDHTEERFDGLTALVVDDEPDARLLLRRLLEDRGASVLLASSAAEAFTLLVAQRPDVVVSDIGMPVEDGYSFLGRVRALAPADGGITPAIALTAYARPADRIQAMRAGFQLHLVKPVDPAELFAAIVSLIARPAAKR